MEYNEMQLLKRAMFALRNGVIADVLRKAGSPFPIIFGLNLPQISQVAQQFAPDKDFAEKVWANSTTRESMLVAPMLMPPEQMTAEDARRWVSTIPACEVADVLCLKLLRKLSFAPELAEALCADESDMARYTGLRLYCNIFDAHQQQALDAARAELSREVRLTAPVARQILSFAEEL